jgi:signal transduction histidine kinase
MINIEEIKKIIELSNPLKLRNFFSAYKKQIFDVQCKLLSNEQPTAYINFLLNDPEGQDRIRFFIDSIETALKGHIEVFFNDQAQIGSVRALEGYRLSDVLGFTINFKDALRAVIQQHNLHVNNRVDCLDLNDIYVLHKLLDCSYFLLSVSFVKTRDEIIERNKDQLYKLQHYAAEVVSIFEEDKICAYASQGVFDIYGLYGTFAMLPSRDNDRPFENIKLIGLQIPIKLVNRVFNRITPYVITPASKHVKGCHSGLDPESSTVLDSRLRGNDDFDIYCRRCNKTMAIDSNENIIPFEEFTPNKPLVFICQPIRDLHNSFLGVLFVHNQENLFSFSKFDGDLINQFCYFTGAVLSNSIMATKLVEKKEELRNLAGRLISFQEFERKEIAADIHDTLTQALTGMGYKALLCQEIMRKDPNRLSKELNELVALINKGLQESRQIISNLRPYMLDDIGMVAAFKKLLNDFKNSTGIEPFFSSPDKITLDSDKSIALFRILQESLSNIKKHSQATKVRISLDINAKNGLCLQVHDNGKGFIPWQRKRMVQGSGMGLLIMRERTKELNGKFDVFSRPAEGCKISVTIP